MNEEDLRSAFQKILHHEKGLKLLVEVNGSKTLEEKFDAIEDRDKRLQYFKEQMLSIGYSFTDNFKHSYLFETLDILDFNSNVVGKITIYN